MLLIRLPARLQHFLFFFSLANIPEITSNCGSGFNRAGAQKTPKREKNEGLQCFEKLSGAWTSFTEV
jgi:hypothetical protein